MNVQQRLDLLEKLGNYILSDAPQWQEAREKAWRENPWFIPEFVTKATTAIAHNYLQREVLEQAVSLYQIPPEPEHPRTVGIVMAGNIPLVGFHDFCCTFLSGHRMRLKPSSKDNVLLRHLVDKMVEWNAAVESRVAFSDLLKGCDAYMATGSNQSSAYFEHYFGKYPHIIRKNRTGVALLLGTETPEELDRLADDVHLYFGLGCRNVTKIYVPEGYDFIPLLDRFRNYQYLAEHHKYKNNYDYQLALLIINKQYYMTNGSLLLVEQPSLFAPISTVHYSYYTDEAAIREELRNHPGVQCRVGVGGLPFGKAQVPDFLDFADGVDTLKFLRTC